MAHHFSPKTVTDGLDFYVDPANPKSYPGTGTSVYDISGNGYVGTLVNGPIHNSTYFTFDGVNESIRFGDIVDRGTSPFTLSAWCRKTGDSPQDPYGGAVASKGSFGGGTYGYSTYVLDTTYNSGKAGFQVRATSAYGIQTPDTYPSNEWAMFTGIRDTVNEEIRFYINGELIGTNDVPNTVNIDSPWYFTIGALNAVNIGTRYDRHFKGDISSVYGYNRTLTVSEIEQNYNALKGRFGL